MTIINGIMEGAKYVAAATSGNTYSSSDSFQDTINSLKGLLIPHLSEDRDKKAEQVKQQFMKEVSKGPMQVKVMDSESNNKSKRRRR